MRASERTRKKITKKKKKTRNTINYEWKSKVDLDGTKVK